MSDDNKEGAGVPVAYVVRDAEGGSLHDFTDYYNADQFWIRNSGRMLKPQFLFCYDAPAAAMPAAPSDAVLDSMIQIVRDIFGGQAGSSDIVAWEMMNARARSRLRAALSQTMQPQAEPVAGEQAGAVASESRCPNCDDTGDVNSITGEWRGVCHCPAGQAINARALAAPGAAIAAREQAKPGERRERLTDADLDAYGDWLSKNAERRTLFPVEQSELLNTAMLCIREVKATRSASREEARATQQGAVTDEQIMRAWLTNRTGGYIKFARDILALTQHTTVQQAETGAASEIDLIEKAAVRVGMKSLMNHGAASCVYTEGCNGVSQEHLIAFAREVALHCAVALGKPEPSPVEATLLHGVDALLHEAYAHWDADRESKVGKILLALIGHNKGYDTRADAWCAALKGMQPGERKEQS